MKRNSLSQDFELLFKDTEKNISSITRHLGGDKGREPFPPRSPVYRSSHHLNSSPHSYLEPSRSPNYSPSASFSQQTTLITSMFKKLEEQTKTIGLLEKTIHDQSKEIERIKHQQEDLKSSFCGNSNSFDVKSRLDCVERDLRSEMNCIRNSIQSSNNDDAAGSQKNNTFKDIEFQRRIENETDAFKREMDGLKSRMVRIESDVNVSLGDVQKVNRKYGEIERDVSNIAVNQKSLRDVTEKDENQLIGIRKEIQEIISMLTSLRKENKFEMSSACNVKDSKQIYQGMTDNKDHVNDIPNSNSAKMVPMADSPTSTLSPVSNFSNISDKNNNWSFNSLDISDSSQKESAEKCSLGDTKHTSLLDDDDYDDNEILRFSSLDDDNYFLEEPESNVSFSNLKLSDDESVTLDELLLDEL